MIVKNISDKKVLIMGIEIQVGQELPIDEFGTETERAPYIQEFIDAINNKEILLLDDNGDIITTDNITPTNLQNIISPSNNSMYIPNNDTFYYNYKTISIEVGQIIEIEFKGYLKTSQITVVQGEIDAQFISPRMNKINIIELNSYSIDSDFKLKDPVVRLTGIKNSEVNLYLDGSFSDSTKTRQQYLDEIYSENTFPQASGVDIRELFFKVNFLRVVKDNKFIDDINGYVGNIFNGATLLNFNKFEDGAYVNFGNILNTTNTPFTFSIFFNFGNDITKKQYIFYKHRYYYSYVQNNVLYLYLNGKRRLICNLCPDKWYMLTITYDTNLFYIYLNDKCMLTDVFSNHFSTNVSNLYFGSRNSGHEYMRDGKIGEVSFYTYHMSKGMVDYLYNTNNPNLQFQTNLIPGIMVNEYDCSSKINYVPKDSYDFNIFEKECNNIDHLLFSEILDTLDSSLSTDDSTTTYKLTVGKGKVYIPKDGKYVLKFIGNAHFEVLFNEKTIISNYSTSTENVETAWLEEGYYNIKFRTVSTNNNSYKLLYKEKSETDFYPMKFMIEDTDDKSNTDPTVYISLKDHKYFSLTDQDIQSNAELETFNNIDVFKYEYNKFTSITVDERIYNTQFSVSFWVYFIDDRCVIFSQGRGKWGAQIQARYQNKKMIVSFQGTEKTSSTRLERNEWNKIDIIANNDSIYLYINAKKESGFNIPINDSSWYHSTKPFYINRLPTNKVEPSYEGSFRLDNFNYYLKTLSKEEIENKYHNEKDKFGR